MSRTKAERVLQLPSSYTPEDVKAQYRKLAKQHHPDRPGGNKELFTQVNNANEVLQGKHKLIDPGPDAYWAYKEAMFNKMMDDLYEFERMSREFTRMQEESRMRSSIAGYNVKQTFIFIIMCWLFSTYVISPLFGGIWEVIVKVTFWLTMFSVWKELIPRMGQRKFGRAIYRKYNTIKIFYI